MFEIQLHPRHLHINYAGTGEHSAEIGTGEYLLLRHILADGGYTELADSGNWIPAAPPTKPAFVTAVEVGAASERRAS